MEMKRYDIVTRAQRFYPEEGSHGYNHIENVVDNAWYVMGWLMRHEPKRVAYLDFDLLMAICMFHDAGCRDHGREDHEYSSAAIFERECKFYFNPRQLKIGFEAIIDHRNSTKERRFKQFGVYWRSIYGEILACADRGEPKTTRREIYKRAIEYHLESDEHHSDEEKIFFIYDHVKNKYGLDNAILPDMYRKIYKDKIDKSISVVKHTGLGHVRKLYFEMKGIPLVNE